MEGFAEAAAHFRSDSYDEEAAVNYWTEEISAVHWVEDE